MRKFPNSNLAAVAALALTMVVPLSPANAQSAEPNQANESTLNLDNADIRTLIETVATRTGRSFIVDPRVKANVTVILSESIDDDELYELFLSVLAVHGFAAVEAGSLIKIVPTTAGVTGAIPLLNERSDKSGEPVVPGDELVTEVIRVQNTPAQQMVETLRPLVAAPASISAEATSNTIIITDRAANIARLTEIIQSLDGSN